jgi:hypothetical protein
VTLIDRPLPRRVRMSKVNLRAPLLQQSEILKLRAVIGGDGLENIGEMATIFGTKSLHASLYCLAGLAGNLHGDVVIGHSLHKGKNHRFFSLAQADNCVSFPVFWLGAGVYNSRTFLNTASLRTLIDSVLSLGMTALESIWNLKKRQWQASSLQFMIKSLSVYHLILTEQPV